MMDAKTIQRFETHVLKHPTGCWGWDGQHDWKGYARFWLRTRMARAHRLAYEIYKGPIPEGMWVLHSCDNRGCVNPEHLHIGTAADNTREMLERGRAATGLRSGMHTHPESRSCGARHHSKTMPESVVRGEAHPWHKLTCPQVLEMRQIHAERGLAYAVLGPMFGVCASTASRVIHRRTWTVVRGEVSR